MRGASSRNTPPPRPPRSLGEYFTSGLFCLQMKHLACEYFLIFCFSRGGVVSASSNPQAGGPSLVGCPQLFNQYIRSYPPYRRSFLYPQPEDTPCRGDRDFSTRTRRRMTHIHTHYCTGASPGAARPTCTDLGLGDIDSLNGHRIYDMKLVHLLF